VLAAQSIRKIAPGPVWDGDAGARQKEAREPGCQHLTTCQTAVSPKDRRSRSQRPRRRASEHRARTGFTNLEPQLIVRTSFDAAPSATNPKYRSIYPFDPSKLDAPDDTAARQLPSLLRAEEAAAPRLNNPRKDHSGRSAWPSKRKLCP